MDESFHVSALAEARAAYGRVVANRDLRRLQLAWLGSVSGEFAYSVALSIYAYDVGGATGVGLVWLLRMLPSALGAPFVALVGERYPREWVIYAGNVVRAALAGATAVAVGVGAPVAGVYGLAIAMEVISTVFWPAQAALLPKLARTPAELTAANTVSVVFEGIGSFIGPALCALALAATGVAPALAGTATVFAAAAFFAHGIQSVSVAEVQEDDSWRRLGEQAFAGFAAVLRRRRVRLLVALFTVWAVAQGALNVLVVVLALEVFDLGDAGVGLLMGAVGIGGLLGAVASFALAGYRRLVPYLVIGAIVFGVPLCVLGLEPTTTAGFLLLAALGAGNVVVDVTSLTLLQRATPEDVLMRVLGIVEGLWVAAIGVGAIAVPALIALIGVRGALAVSGAALPVFVLLTWRSLAALDSFAPPAELLRRLHAVPFLHPLRPPALERLATGLVPVRIPPTTVLVRQGDPGDRFYLVASGTARVSVDGREVARLGEGDFFGEIALLRDVPRTATVSALTELELYALERDDFLSAVAANPESALAAEGVVRTRLAGAG
jgi:hypothetical protein